MLLLLLLAIYQTFYKVRCTKRATFPRKSKLHDFALESTFAKIICN